MLPIKQDFKTHAKGVLWRIDMLKKLSRTIGVCLAALLAAAMLFPTAALADSQRVVTLGADLSEEQRATVLDFFGLTEDDLENMQVIEVTNDEERELLLDYVASDIIGYQTISCSYIEPTTSGGINVETANLTYVTKNTIYNALQTAGVENCNVVVTAPFEVSGTGALTGIFLAYEANGESLDEDKESAAAEELVASAALEDTYGEDVVSLISDVKNDVTSSTEDLSSDEISDLISQYASEKGLSLSDEDIQTIISIAERIQELDYDSDAFSTTLDEINSKLSGIAESADGILGAIQSFFKQIGEWISNLIALITGSGGSSESDADTEETQAHSTEGILGSLNTDVFELDETTSSGTDEDTSSDTADGNTQETTTSSNDAEAETDNTEAGDVADDTSAEGDAGSE